MLRPGIVFVLTGQGLYWLGVALDGQPGPLGLLGLFLARGYRNVLFALTILGLVLIAAAMVQRIRTRRSAG